MDELIVNVSEGKLQGKVCTTPNEIQFYAFKAIPYAKPPIGDLRFAIPQPPDPWSGVRDATIMANTCAQFDKKLKTVTGSEDCLYLNVYTPKLPSKEVANLPVMVFLHGGGFLFGSGTDDTAHGPDYLLEKEVVVVSINYRLGILGFLSLDIREAPGNMGLRDQIQALKWVQQNIHSFNGNPNNVTLHGFSAGAASAEYLLLSPMAKGLFHKTIAQSGSTLNPWTHNYNILQLAMKIPLLKGITIMDPIDLLEYLKNLHIIELISSSMVVLVTSKQKGLNFGFVPTVERPRGWDPCISKPAYDLLLKGAFPKIPILVGYCNREGLLIHSNLPELVKKVEEDKEMTLFMPFDLEGEEREQVENKLNSIYIQNNRSNESDDFAIDFLGDVGFFTGIYEAANIIAKHDVPVYFYKFSYDGGLNYLKNTFQIDRRGACHGDDGGYIIKTDILPENVSETDKLVRRRIIEMWTNFAKTGNPTPETNEVITTTWNPIPKTGFKYLEIDDKLTMKDNLEPEKVKLFGALYAKHYTADG